MLGLGTAWYTAGNYEKAASWFYKAADAAPQDLAPYLFLGKVQVRELVDSPEYADRMARFAKLHPESALAQYYYALSIWNRRAGPEDVEASRLTQALLRRAIELDPRLAEGHLQLGIVHAAEREYDQAIEEYRRAIEVNAAIDEAHYRLSAAYRLTGQTAKADEELAIYNRESRKAAEALERERSEIQQFVVNMKGAGTAR
jgi:tetratricopeptide (TPR) repeat protein